MADPETPLLSPEEALPPLSYLQHHRTITRPLSTWEEGISQHHADLDDWAITKIEHMKNFHFSSVMHEYLRATVRRRSSSSSSPDPQAQPDEAPTFLFAERMLHTDEITVGWKKVPHPELTGWWIKRWLRGYFGDAQHGVAGLQSSSSVPHWKDVGYSGSDYLCHLEFAGPGVPLLEFAEVLTHASAQAPTYSAASANCFWFAVTVYNELRERFRCTEFRGIYYKHRGKFAGWTFLPWTSSRRAAQDIESEKKRSEKLPAIREKGELG